MKFRTYLSMVVFYTLIIATVIGGTYLASEATSAVAQLIPVEREHTIVIDAGHGGVDGGATSCTGVLESSFNLEIAVRLNDLMHLLGYPTVMIRTDDRSVYTKGETIAQKKVSDLKERVRIVNSLDDAILISIHQNTFPDGKYSGAQVFYGPEGECKILAESLQTAFGNTLNPGSKRSCKKAEGIYLMQHIQCTGVLVECGFLSNPQEEANLRNPDYQRKLAVVIGATVGEYLSNT